MLIVRSTAEVALSAPARFWPPKLAATPTPNGVPCAAILGMIAAGIARPSMTEAPSAHAAYAATARAVVAVLNTLNEQVKILQGRSMRIWSAPGH